LKLQNDKVYSKAAVVMNGSWLYSEVSDTQLTIQPEFEAVQHFPPLLNTWMVLQWYIL